MRYKFKLRGLNAGSSLASKLGASLFFAVFAGMGLLFLGLLGTAFLQTLEPYFWAKAPAQVLSSQIDPDGEDYRVTAHYRYSWEGQNYESETFSQPKQSFGSYDEATKALAGLTAGSEATCWVNSKNPTQAVLHLSSLWLGCFILLPIAFVLVGFFGIRGTWFPADPVVSPNLASKAPRLIGAVFALVGLGVLLGWSIPMWIKAAASAQWPEVPCTVISSHVKSHSSKDGTTYRPVIFYRYTFEGREYRSDHFDVVGGSSSGYDAKKEIVDQYPPGSTQVCFVNPKNPSEALLRRGFSWGLLFGLLPLIFLGVGCGLFFYRPAERTLVRTSPDTSSSAATARLRATASPRVRVLAAIGIAIFWNGIVSIFLFDLIGGFRRGHPDWFLAAFLVPFVLIGLAMIGTVIYFLLALSNPRIEITLDDAEPIEPGGTLKLSWRMDGATRRLERLVIYLEGREEATYRRGTNSTTDCETFFRQPIADLTGSWMDFQEGNGSLALPLDVMPTFRAKNNRIIWVCRAWGKIPRWPDVNEEFEIMLNPRSRPS